MATVPAPATWVASTVVTSTQLNTEIRDTETFLISPPSAFIYQQTAQTLTTGGAGQLITFDTAQYQLIDTNVWSAGTNPSRITFKTAGYHLFTATLSFFGNGTGIRSLDVRLNAAGSSAGGTRVDYKGENAQSSGSTHVVKYSGIVQVNGSTDYIEMFGVQTSTISLALIANGSGGGWKSAVSLQTRWLNS